MIISAIDLCFLCQEYHCLLLLYSILMHWLTAFLAKVAVRQGLLLLMHRNKECICCWGRRPEMCLVSKYYTTMATPPSWALLVFLLCPSMKVVPGQPLFLCHPIQLQCIVVLHYQRLVRPVCKTLQARRELCCSGCPKATHWPTNHWRTSALPSRASYYHGNSKHVRDVFIVTAPVMWLIDIITTICHDLFQLLIVFAVDCNICGQYGSLHYFIDLQMVHSN